MKCVEDGAPVEADETEGTEAIARFCWRPKVSSRRPASGPPISAEDVIKKAEACKR